MKCLILVTMVCVLGLSAYGCAYKCVAVPGPGGYSYERSAERPQQADKQ
jgi:hypothetical protein